MPAQLRQECASDAFYHRCARNDALHDHECGPNPLNGKPIEWEHALIFGANQVQRKFAIVPLCWRAHSGPDLDKEINVWIALNRASESELRDISKAVDYPRMRARLNAKYGTYTSPEYAPVGIQYPWLRESRDTDHAVLAKRVGDGHILIRADDGTLSCNCPSFVYRDTCRHVAAFVGEQSTLALPI